MKKRTTVSFENNSLDWARLFAALQIAVTHFMGLMLISYRNENMTDTVLLYVKRTLSFFPGLILLFSISGFLMGNALERMEDRNQFLRKRFLRIYPGLWANVVLTAVMIVLLLRPTAAERKSLLLWMAVQFSGIAYTPEFLQGFGTGSVNGTLWTIMVEIQFYLLLFVFWDFLKKRRGFFWGLCLGSAVALNLLCGLLMKREILTGSAAALLERTCLPYLVWFLIGFCLYRFRDRIMPGLISMLPVLWLSYILYRFCWQICGWPVSGYYEDIIASLMLPLLTIGTAYALGKHRWKNDISYGIFLYHWVVINVIFWFDLPAKMNHVWLFFLYCLVFCLLGGASWFLLEKRVLKK